MDWQHAMQKRQTQLEFRGLRAAGQAKAIQGKQSESSFSEGDRRQKKEENHEASV